MTRRLGGIGSKSLAALSSLSLATALACGFAMTGCGGDSNPMTTPDGGMEGSLVDVVQDRGQDVTTMMDAGMDVTVDVTQDRGQDVTPPPVDGGPDVVDSGVQCAAPTFMPVAGMINQGSTVTIVPPTGFPAAPVGFMFFTTDGTLPTHASQAYSGPIQVSQNETIRVIAFAQGVCTDSVIASATYTVIPVQVDGGVVAPPDFNPKSTTQTNDFTVTLSGAPGATICYALGTAAPTCTNGVCQPGSTTYAGTGISVSGTITDAATGKVTITALACMAGSTNSAAVPQTYTLQSAPPVMVMPDNSAALAYVTNGAMNANATAYTPTISSPTNGSIIRYFTGTSTPNCVTGTGTQLTNPYLLGSTGALGPITQNTLFQTVACKTGYAPSAVTPVQYWVQLNKPTFAKAAGTYHTATVSAVVSDLANGGSSDWLCWTTDNSPPGCGATTGLCTAGVSTAPAVTATGQNINVIACSGSNGTTNSGFQNSVIPDSSGAYTLQLDPIDFNPPGAGVGSYTFVTADGASRSATIQHNGTGDAPSYVCAGSGATVDCTCNTVAGHGTQYAIGNMVTVMPGQTWTGYACSADATVILNSGATAATYNPAGSATPPSIAPVSGNYTAQQTIVLTNAADIPSFLCWTTNGATPTPGAGCTTSGSTTCSGSAVALATAFNTTVKVQASNTVVKAVACNTTEVTSPTPNQTTYTFQLAEPTITATTAGDLNGGGAVSGNQAITIGTASDFTGETINYSDNGSAVNCTTAQHTVANGSLTAGAFTYTVATNVTSVTLNIIACGTAQSPSAARGPVTLTIGSATPIITNTGADGSHSNLTWENAFNATVSSTTPGATICYRTNGNSTGLSCTLGVCDSDPNTVAAAAPATVPITTSGMGLVAVACTGTLASTGMASANYTLNVTPVAITSDNMCSATFTIAPATSTIGGPTTGATLCYSTTGSFSYCGPQGGAPAGVTCAAYASTGLAPVASSGNIWVTTCRTGFNGDTGSMHAATVTAYTNNNITINGTNDASEWTAGDTLAGTAGTTGYFTHNASTLFFGASGYTAAAGTDVVVYLGDGTGGTTTKPAPFGTGALPFGAKWAFGWATNNTGVVEYAWSGTAWAATTFSPNLTVQFVNFVEMSLPLAAIGSPGTVDMAGAIVTGVGTPGAATAATWPTSGVPVTHVHDVLSSCHTPLQQAAP
jgi:hypothetical protein